LLFAKLQSSPSATYFGGVSSGLSSYAGHNRTVKIHVLDPLVDTRWDDLVGRHPEASAFHHRGWLEALSRTYGYKPFALTTTPDGEPLRNGLAVCRVSSWITGTRLVSLPFSDHCQPLLHDPGELPEFVDWLKTDCDRQQGRYVELRPLSAAQSTEYGLQPASSYWFHELDIRADLDQLYRRLHNNSFRRKLLRAEREHLSYEAGNSQPLVNEFYRLLLTTRKRHQLLPQPRNWFTNLVTCLGDKVQIRLTRKNGVAIAAMLTMQHRACVVYKYGCSDEKFHSLGGMPFLFWRLVKEGKASGVEKIDFGRTDLNNEGLIAFKDRFGTSRRLLTYYRHPKTAIRGVTALRDSQVVTQVFSLLPGVVSSIAGRILYRHMG
jgi:CelD/BcsL family acetyltransferase involved in cellulose biosynthesis